VCAIQGAGPYCGPERGYNRGNFGYMKNIPLKIQWPECIDIWYKALSWDKEIQVCANKVPGVINKPTPKRHSFV